MITQCCLCKKIQKGPLWLDPVPTDWVDDNVSHGYCPDCAEEVMDEIRQLTHKPELTLPRAAGAC